MTAYRSLTLFAPFRMPWLVKAEARVRGNRALPDTLTAISTLDAWHVDGAAADLVINPSRDAISHPLVRSILATWSVPAADQGRLQAALDGRLPAAIIDRVEIHLGEHGIGVASIDVTLPTPIDQAGRAHYEGIEGSDDLAPALDALASAACATLAVELRAADPPVIVDVDASVAPGGGSTGILWTHRVWATSDAAVVSAPPETTATLLDGRATVAVGDGSSEVIAEAASLDEAKALATRTLLAAEAYWATLSEHDAAMIHRLREHAAELVQHNPNQSDLLHRSAVRVQAVIHETRSVVTLLPPDEGRLWDAMEVAWRVPRLEATVNEKIDAVSTLDAYRSDQAEVAWQRRLSIIAVVFGAAALLSTMLDALGFATDDRELVVHAVRVVLLVAFVSLVAVATGYLIRRQRRR